MTDDIRRYINILTEEHTDYWHGSISTDTTLRPGMHIGTKKQAQQRIADRTEYNKVSGYLYRIKEKNTRDAEEYIKVEDNGSPTLKQALSRAARIGKIPENIARIAQKKSEREQARILQKYGIHRVIYKNKFEGTGESQIIVNPDDFEIEIVDRL